MKLICLALNPCILSKNIFFVIWFKIELLICEITVPNAFLKSAFIWDYEVRRLFSYDPKMEELMKEMPIRLKCGGKIKDLCKVQNLITIYGRPCNDLQKNVIYICRHHFKPRKLLVHLCHQALQFSIKFQGQIFVSLHATMMIHDICCPLQWQTPHWRNPS